MTGLCFGLLLVLIHGEVQAERFVRRAPPGAEETTEPEPPPSATPPELIRFVQAEYPEQAYEEGLEAEVLLQIEIGADGTVTNVAVEEPAGQGFDDAAVAAVRQFEFVPAMVGEEPSPSRILYRYRFQITEEVSEPTQPETIEVSGLITDLDDVEVPAATVILTRVNEEGELEEPLTLLTDEDGRFSVESLPIGRYEVLVEASGFVSYERPEPVLLENAQELSIRLEREGSQYETVIRARRPGEQMTTRTLDSREIDRVPGASGDPLRVIQSLPGMGRPPAGLGLLIVRGSPPGDTNVLLESVGVPLLYHFGGFTSVFNGRYIDAIEFNPGNYPVRYGGAHGGIVEVQIRELQREPYVGWHGEASADLIDAEIALEGPITDDLSFAFGLRRSYIDLVAGAFAGFFDDFQLTTAPRYWDWQAILQYTPSSRHFLRAIGYGSQDTLELVTQAPPDQGEVVMGSLGSRTAFHGAMLQYRYRPERPIRFDLTASATWLTTGFEASNILDIEIDNLDVILRPEVTFLAGEWGRFLVGAKLPINHFSALATLPDLNAQGCALNVVTRPWESNTSFGPRLYAETQLRPTEHLHITAGLQADYYGYQELFILEPRIWLRYEIRDGTAVEGGVGVFHQAPGFLQSDQFFGNPALGLEQSVHYGLGVQQRIWGPINLTVNGFFKWIDRRGVESSRVVERDGEPVPLRYEGTGRGRIYGLELLLRHEPTRRFFGWLSYTLMRAEDLDDPAEGWILSSFDQTHILTLVAGVQLPRGWEIGLRFQLTSGRPYTPLGGTVYEAECDTYTGIPGEARSERMPLFHQLDIRIDKTWVIRDVVRIWLYLDLQNVYYSQNVEGYFYSFDYSRRYSITGLPILPNLGLGIEF